MTLSLNDWNSVEGSARMSMEVTRGVTPVYGSLYVQQYYDRNDLRQFVNAIRTCLQETNGIMIFDLCHIESFDWWEYLKEGLETY